VKLWLFATVLVSVIC